ncbi:lysozyme inhibitor LprI family protein [Nocardia sp. NPDC059240]|uniref:lysozyme inhibitor LprI family protein n=1 Tax=Nocardia sp. NPDC059240 TaxID=3346786 RepID=UPI003699E21F
MSPDNRRRPVDVWSQDTDVFEPIRDDYEPPPRRRSGAGRAVALGAVTAVIAAAATVGGLYFAGIIGGKDKPSAVATSVAPVPVAGAPSTSAAPASGYVPIIEFNSKDKQPAKRQPTAETCSKTAYSTVDMEDCKDRQIEDVDAQIDVVQKAKFDQATAADRQAILDDDSAWLAARPTVCGAEPQTGGTIDGLRAGDCALSISQARLAAVKGTDVAAVKLPLNTPDNGVESGTYTTPKGSRITVVVQFSVQVASSSCWTIIGGYAGFTVNTDQFTYVKNSSTVTPEDSDSANGHRVGTGESFKFCLRYPHSYSDTDGSLTYSPGSPAALWSVTKK